MAGSCPRPALALLALALLPGLARSVEAPQVPVLAPADRSLPIDLSADFSEFDRRNDRLLFRGLRIVQGTLAISADEATANPADFEDSTWTFTGNVVITNGNTRATCARAEMSFRQNQLRQATLTGQPARFTQERPGGGQPTEGRAGTLDYDLAAGTIRMTNDAFLSDGTNEIAGARIAYDLRREVVSAGEPGQGPVRMKIIPRSGGGVAGQPPPSPPTPAPAPTPAPEAAP